MGLFDSLTKRRPSSIEDQETSNPDLPMILPSNDAPVDSAPVKEQDPFAKFNEANKANRLPRTDLNVANSLSGAYDKSQELRSKALDKIAEATDFGTPVVGPNQDYRAVAKQGLDMIAPNVTDLIPMGKLGAIGSLGMKEAKVARGASGVAKTAEEMMQGVRLAQLEDLGKNSNLIGKPVFATAEEKFAQALSGASGKVKGGGSNAAHVKDLLLKDERFKDLAKRKTTISRDSYDREKQVLLNIIRKENGGM